VILDIPHISKRSRKISRDRAAEKLDLFEFTHFPSSDVFVCSQRRAPRLEKKASFENLSFSAVSSRWSELYLAKNRDGESSFPVESLV
jgi:hypothetical protein